MTVNLENLRGQVQEILCDPANLVWQDTTLDEAIRQALDEYNRGLQATAILAGLDGALITSLPAGHENPLALGAAGYAALARTAQRSEAYNPDPQTGVDFYAWAKDRLSEYQAALEQIRRHDLKSAASVPWAETGWKLDAWEGE